MRDRRGTNLSVSSTSSSNSSTSTTSDGSNHEKAFLTSPPPSPTLPPPVTKGHKRRPPAKRKLALKGIALVCGLVLIYHYILCGLLPRLHPSSRPLSHENDASLEGASDLPEDPTPLIVTDEHGDSKWTVSIPTSFAFPLQAPMYREICMQSERIGNTVAKSSRSRRPFGRPRQQQYYEEDVGFLDVARAENADVLPKSPRAPMHVVGQQDAYLYDTCKRSLTFVMDTKDASFGKTLLLLWLSYGLAKKEGRAFFIDDTRWPYGSYTSYFKLPPTPGCAPPSASHVLPCPHSADHILVSAETVPWTFGPSFRTEFEDARSIGLDQNGRVFDMMRAGYNDLFHLLGEDANYLQTRVRTLREDANAHGGAVIGMHMRRGDLHPFEYQYSRDYLPLDRYVSAARHLLQAHVKHRHGSDSAAPSAHSDVDDFSAMLESLRSPLLVSSDDPEIYSSPDLSLAASPFALSPAQDRIQLATKAALDKTSPAEPLREPGSAYVKHVDENSGWEGGFYSALFYSLGRSRSSTEPSTRPASIANETDAQTDGDMSEQTLRMRQLIGRAYLLDLAVLGHSDGVVCTVSSAACRVLAIMMGRDAVTDGRWKNVDDGRMWSWDGLL